jgi:predicted dehydrogenase
MGELGIVIVGAGMIAHSHASALDRIPGVRVTHVVSHKLGDAQAVARLAPGAVATTDRGAALADPAVDAAVIATPTDSHAALSIEAMTLGKQVLVEKPAALSLADFDRMTATAKARGVSLMVGQTSRFQPVHLELHRAVSEGEAGRLHAIKLTWYAGYVWPRAWRAWQLDLARSGGHPVHNGVHPLDLAVWLLGRPPRRVFARSFRTFSPDVPMPDSFHITVKCEDALALIELSYGLARPGANLRRLLAIGEQGTIEHRSDGEEELLVGTAAAPAPSLDGAMDYELGHWVATLRGEAPLVRGDEVRATLAAALAAQRSLETGRAVGVEEVE